MPYKFPKEAYNVPKVAALSESYEAPREPYKVAKRLQGFSQVPETFDLKNLRGLVLREFL